MSSPNSNQYAHQARQYQQPPPQYPDKRYSLACPQNQLYYGHHAPEPAPYIQPHYGAMAPAPFIAELPAPLPLAPPTTTPEQQLKEDEMLAHKFQQMEVEEVRRRSSSAVSQHLLPVSYATPNPQNRSPLLHQRSAQSLQPHSQSISSTVTPYSSGSFGLTPSAPSPSLLPEVVEGPRPVESYTDLRSVSYHKSSLDNLPIPVLLDQQTTNFPPSQSPPAASATLSTYLEEHRQVPYPPTWKLPPVIATFYAYPGSKTTPGSDWLSQAESFTWRTIRPTEHVYNPSPPSYTFRFMTKGGSYRDPRFSWVMTSPGENIDPKRKISKSKVPTWAYDLRLDLNTGVRKTEVLSHGHKEAILTTYVHALNYDSLRFIGPDGRAYMWVSSNKVSSVNDSRFDTIRHALFAAVGRIPDPLYGEIVADHTFWDGYVDEKDVHKGANCDGCQASPITGLRWKCRTCHHHEVCEACHQLIVAGGFGAEMQRTCDFSLVCLPDEALYIRSLQVDPALVVASLQVLKDWEKHTFRGEKKKDPEGLKASEEAARKGDLGLMSYWKASDWDTKKTEHDCVGTMVKAKSMVEGNGEATSALGSLVGSSAALVGHGTGGGRST